MNVKLQQPVAVLSERKHIPDSIQACLMAGEQELAELGYQFLVCYQSKEIRAELSSPAWTIVMSHPEHRHVIEVTPHLEPDIESPIKFNVYSYFDDGTTLLTMNYEKHSVIGESPDFIMEDALADNIVDVIEAHKASEQRYIGSTQGMASVLRLSAESYMVARNTLYKTFFNSLLNQKMLTAKEGYYAFTLQHATEFYKRLYKGLKVLNKRKLALSKTNNEREITPSQQNVLLAAERHAIFCNREVSQSTQFSRYTKTLLFFVSVLVFAMAFGMTMSLDFIVILILVVLFHELGHIAAMWAFGYRDLQILFIPLFGAAASGKKNDPTALQKAIVSLMGPLPGILLGWVLLYVNSDLHNEWIDDTILILFILNFLNLLPFFPLDGGQLLNAVIFDRHPRLQFAFIVISTLAIAYGAWLLSDPILTGLAILLAMSLFSQLTETNVLGLVLQRGYEPSSESENLTSVLNVLLTKPYQKFTFHQKYTLSVKLLERMRHRLPKWWETVIALSLYLSIILTPLIYFGGNLYAQYMSGKGYYDEQIENAQTPDEKFLAKLNAGIYMTYSLSDDAANDYFNDILQESKNKPNLSSWYSIAVLAQAINTEQVINEQLITPLKQNNLSLSESNALRQLGTFASYKEVNYRSVLNLYEVAYQNYKHNAHYDLSIASLLEMAAYATSENDVVLAERYFQQAEQDSQQVSSPSRADVLFAQSEFYFSQGRYKDAESALLTLQQLISEQDMFELTVQINANLSWILLASDDLPGATRYAALAYQLANDQSLTIDEDNFDYTKIDVALQMMVMAVEQNNRDEALRFYQEAQSIGRNLSIDWDEYLTSFDMSEIESIQENQLYSYRTFKINSALKNVVEKEKLEK
ncbi:site-2 protease family protein [Pleionea litopenaei]|uniref:Site-2 protease family protein n=1 Tax=Pleionea litopenaei TaxID=3070815 RepID=A0AA51X8C0_9GAMM|nr:site-2 protease family protein [Pleionea sp. HL-JVS1]WMS87955.1 site-2 protease family protein [Pleionea sp. HL-JVS1]